MGCLVALVHLQPNTNRLSKRRRLLAGGFFFQATPSRWALATSAAADSYKDYDDRRLVVPQYQVFRGLDSMWLAQADMCLLRLRKRIINKSFRATTKRFISRMWLEHGLGA